MSNNDILNGNHLEGDEAHRHFMRVVYQVNNIACLFEQNEDGSVSAIFVTPAFAKMMECDSQEEALMIMDGENLFKNTYEEDRRLIFDMLRNRIGPDGTQDITVRRITSKGNIIWCAIHYAFIDDYDRHYVYCTYADLTRLKRYEEQLQSVYTSLGESFHQTDDDSLARVRANLTTDIVEEANGASSYVTNSENMSETHPCVAAPFSDISYNYYFEGGRNPEERAAIDVLDYILSARYLALIREERGGAYSVQFITSVSPEKQTPSHSYVDFQTRPEVRDLVLADVQEEMDRMCADGPTAEEMELAVKYLVKHDSEKKARIARSLSLQEEQMSAYVRWGLPYDCDYEKLVRSLKPADIRSLARKISGGKRLVMVYNEE